MGVAWLYILFGLFAAFVVLKIMGNERQGRRATMEYEHQCRLYVEMIELKRRGF